MPLSRRTFLWGLPPTVLSTQLGSRLLYDSRHVKVPLYSSTVAIGDDGRRFLVPPGEDWTNAGSRILRTASQRIELQRQEAAWQRTTRIPGTLDGSYADAFRLALLDLRVLTLPNGAAVAGWSPSWRYVWPRDSAFVVAALAASGHLTDAAKVLDFLQRLQPQDGVFQARYLPDGSGRTPDRRGIQLDGSGWTLWAMLKWAEAVPAHERTSELQKFAVLLHRSTSACLRLTDNGTTLPPPSSDYWEIKEEKVTLGTAALFLVGLQASAKLHSMLGDPNKSGMLSSAAIQYQTVITCAFSQNGYSRYTDGDERDAAIAFLLPPFVDEIEPAVVDAWQKARSELRRPAGGLAPGAGWKHDGISWTPQTSLFALAAASIGARDLAEQGLGWLIAHRTTAGSFPEKVLSDGEPAAVAPLAWTAAAVVLAVHALTTRP